MGFLRFFLVIVMVLSASVSGAMDVAHGAAMEHSHAAIDAMADDHPVCCSDSSENTQACQALAALLPGTDMNDAAPATCMDIAIGAGLRLTGIDLSGPLDPPRAVSCVPHPSGRDISICKHT